MSPARKVAICVTAIGLVILGGTVGFHLIEGVDLFQSFYFTVVTLFTVGYGELPRESDAGRLFSSILIIVGVGTVTVTVGFFTQMLVAGEMRSVFGRLRVDKHIDALKDHAVVVGYGRVGRVIVEEYRAKNVPFLVVDREQSLIEDLDRKGILALHGDATSDETLIKAGVKRARQLITALENDADNVFVTLSARQHNPSLLILARANDESAEKKLYLAGANKVVVPHRTGAMQMAQAALRPAVVNLIEIATRRSSHEFAIEEIRVPMESGFADQTLRDLNIGRQFGVIIIGIRRDEKMIFNPHGDSGIHAGDVLIALGPPDRVSNLESHVHKKSPRVPGGTAGGGEHA